MSWQYGTHVEILERVLEKLKPTRAIEHGSGEYSTPIIAKYAEDLECIEGDPDYQERALELAPEVVVLESWDLLNSFDFAFVDGKPDERAQFARDCFRANIPVIIWHDSEPAGMSWYDYNSVDVPGGYEQIRWRHREGKRKGTTLFWINESVDLGYPDRWKIEDHDRA